MRGSGYKHITRCTCGALTSLAATTLYKLGFTEFKEGAGLPSLADQMTHEFVILRHFEKSRGDRLLCAHLFAVAHFRTWHLCPVDSVAPVR